MSATPRLRLREGVISVQVGDETVAWAPPGKGSLHLLDRAGGAVLELCDGVRDAGEIATALGFRFQDDDGKLVHDVHELVDHLVQLQLVERLPT